MGLVRSYSSSISNSTYRPHSVLCKTGNMFPFLTKFSSVFNIAWNSFSLKMGSDIAFFPETAIAKFYLIVYNYPISLVLFRNLGVYIGGSL